MSKIALTGNALGSGTLTLAAPSTNTDRTLTLPDEAGTVLTSGGAIDVSASAPADSVAIDSSGNVGIGTSSPIRKLTVSQAGTAEFVLQDTTRAVDGRNFRIFYDNGGLAFGTLNDAGTAGTERVRIDSSGRVTMPYQSHVYGCPTNTGGSGNMNNFHTETSQGGMSVSGTAITVPVTGLYLVTFTTICDTTTGRVDAAIVFSDGATISTLSETNGDGYHYRSASVVKKMSASDYVWFSNDDWYDYTNTGYSNWRTASVTLIG
jgi:hypothetical protein